MVFVLSSEIQWDKIMFYISIYKLQALKSMNFSLVGIYFHLLKCQKSYITDEWLKFSFCFICCLQLFFTLVLQDIQKCEKILFKEKASTKKRLEITDTCMRHIWGSCFDDYLCCFNVSLYLYYLSISLYSLSRSCLTCLSY